MDVLAIGPQITQASYTCPVHGDIQQQIWTSTIPGHDGDWCMLCFLEALDRIGVQRVTPNLEGPHK